MADLPDLDTTTVSYIAYWNAIDTGAISSIDAEDITTSGRILNYTLYDNGLEGEIDLAPTGNVYRNNGAPTAQFRVKNDGWFAVYTDRTEKFTQDTDHDGESNGTPRYPASADGWWRLDVNWAASDASSGRNVDVVNNSLVRTIDHLRRQLSNSGNTTLNAGDAGLYNYQYDVATTTTYLSTYSSEGSTQTPGFSYTSETDLRAVVVTGATQADYDDTGDVKFEGTRLARATRATSAGVQDVLAAGSIPNAGTEYEHNPSNEAAVMTVCAMWA